jgi:hypothetical protein
MQVAFDAEKRWLTMQRGAVRTLMNIGGEAVQFEMREGESLLLRSREDVAIAGGWIALPAMSLAVVMVKANERPG